MSLSAYNTKLRQRAPTPAPPHHEDEDIFSETSSRSSFYCVGVGQSAAVPTVAVMAPSRERPSKDLAYATSHVGVGFISGFPTPPHAEVENQYPGLLAPVSFTPWAWTKSRYRLLLSNVVCNLVVIGPFYQKEVLVPGILTQDEMRSMICQNGIDRVHGIWLQGKRLGKHTVDLLLGNVLKSNQRFLVMISAAYPSLIRSDRSDGQHFGDFVADQAAYERYRAAMRTGKMNDVYRRLKERFGVPQGY
ncbi:hypothetical protein B0J12DRAFT_733504 [Macrophomina phaseolina]|uniref:Uncharacterized protein n=1 Tax=Macrophomina phaseolina TaxID=35725 RepID=A0ABQ8FU64_9PEZI|nr:hypothetical protein B0J12DRAFT_733504 [Macrophomina phaseolina]